MILIDYNGVAVGNIITQKLTLDENLIRHMILNSIRMYRKKFGKEYGEVVIVCDSLNTSFLVKLDVISPLWIGMSYSVLLI